MAPLYDYWCPSCDNVKEVYHSMMDRPQVPCRCGDIRKKLISTGIKFCGVNGRNDLYQFVDTNTTGKPVVINSKRQWKNHLKAHGLHDDVHNTPIRVEDLKEGIKVDKDKQRRELKKALGEAVKDKAHTQRVKKVLTEKLTRR